MDPDTALANLRDAVARFRSAQDGDSGDAEYDAAVDMADAAEALDQWITKGGFLPAEWNHGRVQNP